MDGKIGREESQKDDYNYTSSHLQFFGKFFLQRHCHK